MLRDGRVCGRILDAVNVFRRAGAAAIVFLALVGTVGYWYFRSSNTRLTDVPRSDAPVIMQERLPAPRSVVVIIEENRAFLQIVGNVREAPYLNGLIPRGALFTSAYGVAHPSQPNYFGLFSGRVNTNGDSCDVRGLSIDAANLGGELRAAGRSFRGYAESLPRRGFAACSNGEYARKHAPWTHFRDVPASASVPLSALSSYAALPTVAFVIPNLVHDMHSADTVHGDAWLRDRVAPLLRWANQNNTLVVVTWDESSAIFRNHIMTLFLGPMVKPGRYPEAISHYRVLRTIEDFYGLPHAGASARVRPIEDCWIFRNSPSTSAGSRKT